MVCANINFEGAVTKYYDVFVDSGQLPYIHILWAGTPVKTVHTYKRI